MDEPEADDAGVEYRLKGTTVRLEHALAFVIEAVENMRVVADSLPPGRKAEWLRHLADGLDAMLDDSQLADAYLIGLTIWGCTHDLHAKLIPAIVFACELYDPGDDEDKEDGDASLN